MAGIGDLSLLATNPQVAGSPKHLHLEGGGERSRPTARPIRPLALSSFHVIDPPHYQGQELRCREPQLRTHIMEYSTVQCDPSIFLGVPNCSTHPHLQFISLMRSGSRLQQLVVARLHWNGCRQRKPMVALKGVMPNGLFNGDFDLMESS